MTRKIPRLGTRYGFTRGGDPVLLVGGAGFVGVHLADRLAASGVRVRVLDNFSREGSAINATWLDERHADRIEFLVGDVRERAGVRRAVEGVSCVFHLAARTGVPASVIDPVRDFEVNLRGTLELLEALRRRDPVPLVFASTSKVYGDLRGLEVEEHARRFEPADPDLRSRGVGETQPLSLRSPHACSRGAADQYVLDYAATFGVPTVSLRMSCVYGPRQLPSEDDGFVTDFLVRALEREAITLHGDGKQVRDILYVDDMVDALVVAAADISRLAGRAFNIGGTPRNSVSLLELLDEIEALLCERPPIRQASWRLDDQPYYTSDATAFSRETAWSPRIGVRDGLRRLHTWLLETHASAPSAAPHAHAPPPEPAEPVGRA